MKPCFIQTCKVFLCALLSGISLQLYACNNSYLSLDSVTVDGGNKYTIYFQFCTGGGYDPNPPINDTVAGADSSTMDFWFEVVSDTGSNGNPLVKLCPNGYPTALNSTQFDSGCSNCQAANAFYNGVLFNDPGCCPDPQGRCAIGCQIPGFCPSCSSAFDPPFPNCNFPPGSNPYCPLCECPPKPCPSGDSTCVFYTTNHTPYYTGGSFPLCPETCPGGPFSGKFHEYTDIWAGSGRAGAYCVNMYLQVEGGLPDTIIAKGLENETGCEAYCVKPELTITLDSMLSYLATHMNQAVEPHLNSVSPIPTADFATVSFFTVIPSGFTLELIDINGKMMMTQSIQARMGENSVKVNLSNQAPGVYIIKLYNQKDVLSAKVIKN